MKTWSRERRSGEQHDATARHGGPQVPLGASRLNELATRRLGRMLMIVGVLALALAGLVACDVIPLLATPPADSSLEGLPENWDVPVRQAGAAQGDGANTDDPPIESAEGPAEAPIAAPETPTRETGEPALAELASAGEEPQGPGSSENEATAALGDGATPTDAPTAAETPTPTPSVPPASSPPTRIIAPSIDLDAEVVPVGQTQVQRGDTLVGVWEAADYAAGWHNTSRLPGQGGNVVLAGHNNIRGQVFRYLEKIEPGDLITLEADGRSYEYLVVSRSIVPEKDMPEEQRRENARWIGPFLDERLTLITCWPYTGNSHRVIVIAKPAQEMAALLSGR